MDPFEDGGVFWLPDAPDRVVSGHLRFDGEAFSLATDASLIRTNGPDEDGELFESREWIVVPVVLGRMREIGDATVLNAMGTPNPRARGESWSAAAALLGYHIADPVFSKVFFSFDVLVPWAKPPSLVEWDSDPRIGTINLKSVELDRATVGDVTVRLTADWQGQAGGDVLDVRRRCWLRLDVPPLNLTEVLDQWVRPFQDLLVVLLGRPVRLTDLSVVPHVRQPPEAGHGRETTVRVVIGGLVTAPSTAASWASLRNWGAPTMFVREDLPIAFGDLVTGWFEARRSLGEAVTLLCSPFYAPFMYSEHRYAAAFQSAESIARARFPGAERTRQQHRTRVRTIADAARAAAIPEEDIAWAEAVLMSKNNKTLRQLISELVDDAGRLGDKILEHDPDFARTAASARARVSHPGGDDLSAEKSYWYAEVLLWLVRAGLAVAAGVPTEALAERVLRAGHFSQTVERLVPTPETPGGEA